MESPNPSPRSLPAVVQSQLLALPATTSARPESPFPGPGSRYSSNSQAVSVHSSPDAILNGTLIASATRLRRVNEDILSTPSSAERFYGSPNCPKQCDTYVALCGYVSESFCCYPFSKHLVFDFRLPASIYDGKLSPCESARHLINTLTVTPRTGTSQSTTARR